MRTGPNNRRMRGRSNSGGRRGGSPRSQHFDSNGPDIKVRGNAQQIVDKYQTLAREASTAGDRVMAENYYQHAEHYLRILSANQENRPDNSRQDGNRSDNADSGSQEDDAQSDSGDAVDAASGDGGEKANGNGSRRGRSRPADDEAESETVEASDNADDGNDGDDSAETDDSAEKINNPAEIAARASRPRRRRPRPQPTEAGDAAS